MHGILEADDLDAVAHLHGDGAVLVEANAAHATAENDGKGDEARAPLEAHRQAALRPQRPPADRAEEAIVRAEGGVVMVSRAEGVHEDGGCAEIDTAAVGEISRSWNEAYTDEAAAPPDEEEAAGLDADAGASGAPGAAAAAVAGPPPAAVAVGSVTSNGLSDSEIIGAAGRA